MQRLIIKIFCTFFGTGLSPFAPGTVGTAFTSVLLVFTLGKVLSVNDCAYLVSILFLLGVVASDKYIGSASHLDPKEVVIDEVVGIILCTAATYWFLPDLSVIIICILSFIFFRIFDILKPFPISWCDKNIKGGFGIMLDDVIAGAIAILPSVFCGHIIMKFL
jgi:phosphatidylglycerophosphatase A